MCIDAKMIWSCATVFILMIPCAAASCSCRPVTHDDQYCLSDVVMIVHVPNNTAYACSEDNQWFLCFERYFEVEIDEAFKMPVGLYINTSRIYTPGDHLMCGVLLECNKRYIVAGHVEHSKIVVTDCDWVRVLGQNTVLDGFYLEKLRSGTFAADCPARNRTV